MEKIEKFLKKRTKNIIGLKETASLITLFALLFSVGGLFNQVPVAGATTWPTSWTLLNDDDDTDCSQASYGNVLETHYALDGNYLYLRMHTEVVPDVTKTLYKWFLDSNSDAYVSGKSINNYEYLVIAYQGKVYECGPTIEKWEDCTEIGSTDKLNYRIDGNNVDMSINLSNYGPVKSVWWITDSSEQNINQQPGGSKSDWPDLGGTDIPFIPVPFCGDGTLDEGEECDDGNNIGGDGCSATCAIEVPECTIDADCTDGNVCNGIETCSAGTCIQGTPLTCDDQNVCTDDSCDSQDGCVYTNNTAGCDDGDACTENDACSEGSCAGTCINCDDGIECTVDTCVNGQCQHDTSACACTVDADCDDSNPCTDNTCNLGTFTCETNNNTNQCDDNSLCTENDVCSGGSCAGTPISCDDQDVCTDDSCNPLTGCEHPYNTDPCNDGDACTENDACSQGVCSGTCIDCNDGIECTVDTCVEGACQYDDSNCPICEDGQCNYGENCSTCPGDCGTCPPSCGDQSCNGDENCSTCPGDCGTCPPTCGDQSCNGDETCSTCPGDCGACPPSCGDQSCNGDETCSTCPGDCGTCPPTFLNIKAYKVVCQSESDLPNWGNGGSDITSTTAQNFVNGNQNCHLEDNWSFEWAPAGTANPGDKIIGPAGGNWTTFGPTDGNGEAVTTINSLSGDRVWLREVMQEGYIPFSGDTTAPRDNVSAEFYCHNDVLNYDNYDYILNPQLDNTYYCVAFNAPEGPTTYTVTFDGNGGTPTSTEVVVEDGETVDTLPTVTRDGYNFIGWNTQSNGSGDTFTTSTPVIDDITVYAQWQAIVGPIRGCTDSSATNYNSSATVNDGSCTYGSRGGGYYNPPRVLGEEVAAECGLYLFEYIEYGANNNPVEVVKLQTFLNSYMGSNLPLTGVYDLATMNVVNQFQLKCKEEVLKPWVENGGTMCDVNQPTGYVYKTTQRWINLIMCPTLNLPMPDLSGYPKADCAAYWGESEVLGEEVTTTEEDLTEGEAEELVTEEEEIPPPLEVVTQEPEAEGKGMSTLWLIIIIILVAAAVIWFVWKGMKK